MKIVKISAVCLVKISPLKLTSGDLLSTARSGWWSTCMQLFVLAALTLTTSLLRVPPHHHGARTMPPTARAAAAVASGAVPDDDLALCAPRSVRTPE